MKKKISVNQLLDNDIQLPAALKKMDLVDSIKKVRNISKPANNSEDNNNDEVLFRGEPFYKPISKV